VEHHPRSEHRWGGPRVALAFLVAAAAALRLVGLGDGVPADRLDGASEQPFVDAAWRLTHGGGLDPHPFFEVPGLFLYVLAPFEAWEAAPELQPARLAVVVLAAAGVAAAWWLGSAAYDVVAGGVAAASTAVATAHVAYGQAALPDVLLTTLATVALALMVSRRLLGGGFAAGIAVAAKWSGVLLLAPLVVAGWRTWRPLAYAGGLALAGFVAASPFVVRHPGEAAADLGDALDAAWSGPGLAFGGRLWESLGPAVLVAIVGLVFALAERRPEDRVLTAFVLASALALIVLGTPLDRAVLPIIPALGALAGRVRSLAPVTLLLLVVPLTWTLRDDALVGVTIV
jgi:hypothetical protein